MMFCLGMLGKKQSEEETDVNLLNSLPSLPSILVTKPVETFRLRLADSADWVSALRLDPLMHSGDMISSEINSRDK